MTFGIFVAALGLLVSFVAACFDTEESGFSLRHFKEPKTIIILLGLVIAAIGVAMQETNA